MFGKKLIGEIVLIAGGGGEIPGAIGMTLGAEGANVVLVDLSEERAIAVCEKIVRQGGKASYFVGDVAEEKVAKSVLYDVCQFFGPPTILVNAAAAVIKENRIEDLSLDDWNESLRVNLTSAFLFCKYALPEMRKNNRGVVLNIASQLGQIGVPKRSPYSTSKRALIQFTQCMAVEYAKFNIRANTLSPGGTATHRLTQRFQSAAEANESRGPNCLLNRLATVDEIASAALFLVSNDSSFVTGTDLICDGGYLAFKGRTTDAEQF